MSYSLRIKKSAAKSLAKVDRSDRIRLIAAIDRLKESPEAGGVLKGEFSGLRRLRVGRYRIIYEVIHGELLILVVRIGHREEVYRRVIKEHFAVHGTGRDLRGALEKLQLCESTLDALEEQIERRSGDPARSVDL